MSNKDSGLIVAIGFASIAISGSLIFLGLQFGGAVSGEDLGEKIDQGIEAYVQNEIEKQNQPKEEKVGKVKPVSESDHILGSKDAKISLIEYSDFECPFCRIFHKTTKEILEVYDGKVNLVYRHFPLDFHENAYKEAEAVECANEIGGTDKFWEYTDKIFERTSSNGTGFALEALVPLAKEIGIDEKKFSDCLDSGKYAEHVQQDMDEGREAGVTGTPGNILVNNKTGEMKLLSGAQPFETFEVIIEKMLNE